MICPLVTFVYRLYPQSIPNHPRSQEQKPRTHLPRPLHRLMQALTSTCAGRRCTDGGREEITSRELYHHSQVQHGRLQASLPLDVASAASRASPQSVPLKPRWHRQVGAGFQSYLRQ